MTNKAIQDHYPDDYSHCYGCGHQNSYGHRLKSVWKEDRAIASYQPEKHQTGGVLDNAYGGLIASLIDCHGIATAIADAYQTESRPLGSSPDIRFVTGGLNVQYLQPTPIDAVLELHAQVTETVRRKTVVSVTLSAKDTICAQAEVTAIRLKL